MLLLASSTAANLVVMTDLMVFAVGLAIAIIFLLIAIIISSLIPCQPGAYPRDPRQRRIVFWSCAAMTLMISIVFLIVVWVPDAPEDLIAENALKGAKNIDEYTSQFNHYMAMSPASSGISFVFYVLIGFILSKVFRTKKIGDWFNKGKAK